MDIGGSNDKRPGTIKEKRLGVHETLSVAARNVRSIGNKESELVEEIKIEVINIAVISETKKNKRNQNDRQLYNAIQWSFPKDTSPIRRSFNNRP